MTDKIISITDEVKPKNLMSEQDSTAAQNEARAVLDRMDKEKEDLRAQELILDGSNKIRFIGYPYVFEASGEKIIVSIDIFKSGYECKVCGGRRKIETHCICEESDRPGYKYSETMLMAFSDMPGGREAREGIHCSECKGDYIQMRREETCTACKGVGAILIMPKEAEVLPTTGTVISIGALAKRLLKEEEWNYGIGDKVLFSQYAGQFIPCKAGVLLKLLDYNQVMLKIEGADDLDAFDFVLNEKD